MINNKQMTSYIIPAPPLLPGDSEVSAFQVTRPKVIKDTVTQLVDPSTAVVLNAAAGIVTMFTSTLAASGFQAFTVTNSYVGVGSQLIVCVQDYSGTTGLPSVIVDNISDAGTFVITLKNVGNAALNGIVKVGFMVI